MSFLPWKSDDETDEEDEDDTPECDHEWNEITDDFGIQSRGSLFDLNIYEDEDETALQFKVPARRRMECTECGKINCKDYLKEMRVPLKEGWR